MTDAIPPRQQTVSPGRRRNHLRSKTRPRTVIIMIAPFSIAYLAFLIYPTIRVFFLSLTNADIAGIGSFIGLKNYARLIHDPLFWQSMWQTLYFIILTVVPNTALGLVLALLVVRLKKLRGVILAALFIPYILPVSVVTNMYLWVLDANFGIFNYIFHSTVAWFQDPLWAMPAVAFVTIWWTVGFNILLFISGLESIPKEYYEAAALDGANRGTQAFRHITWPLLWPVTSLVLILQLIAQWQIFNQVYLLTNGGPYNKTMVTLVYMYRQAFQQHHGGYASTVAIALFILILITSVIQLRFLRVRES